MLTEEVIVCVGSNVTDICLREVSEAMKWLGELLSDVLATEPYLTGPEGTDAGNACYLNAVIIGKTALSAETLSSMFKDYEKKHGRKAEHKCQGKIIIDIDLVCHHGEIINRAEYNASYFRTGYDRLTE